MEDSSEFKLPGQVPSPKAQSPSKRTSTTGSLKRRPHCPDLEITPELRPVHETSGEAKIPSSSGEFPGPAPAPAAPQPKVFSPKRSRRVFSPKKRAPSTSGSRSRSGSVEIGRPGKRFRGEGEPIKVFLRYRVFSLLDIDSTKQQFSVRGIEEMFIHVNEEEYLEWKAQPSSFKPPEVPQVFGYNATHLVWMETIETPKGATWLEPRLDIHKEAVKRPERLLFRTRMFESTWNEPFALRRFPFDLQMLNLEFQCIVEGNIQVVLLGGPLFSAEFVPPQGEFQLIQFSESRARADGRILPYIASEELTNGGTKYTLTLFVQRSWFFYFHRVMLVLSLVCVTSVTAFLFVEVHEQMNFLVTVLLTIVAYLYFIDDYLPAVSYITMLDAYLYANTFFVMIVIVQCLALYLYYVDEEEDIVVPRLVRIVFFAVNFGIYVSLKAVALIYLFHCMQKDEPGILKLKQVIEKGPGRHRRSAIGSDLASSKLRRLMSTRKISLTVTELNRIIEGAAPNESDDDAEVEMITEEIREEGVSAGGVDESSSCGLDIKAATAGLLASSGGRRNDDTKR